MSSIRRCDACDQARKVEPDMIGTRVRGHVCARCSDVIALVGGDRLMLLGIADYLLTHNGKF